MPDGAEEQRSNSNGSESSMMYACDDPQKTFVQARLVGTGRIPRARNEDWLGWYAGFVGKK